MQHLNTCSYCGKRAETKFEVLCVLETGLCTQCFNESMEKGSQVLEYALPEEE